MSNIIPAYCYTISGLKSSKGEAWIFKVYWLILEANATASIERLAYSKEVVVVTHAVGEDLPVAVRLLNRSANGAI